MNWTIRYKSKWSNEVEEVTTNDMRIAYTTFDKKTKESYIEKAELVCDGKLKCSWKIK